jgi:hypothetical protein
VNVQNAVRTGLSRQRNGRNGVRAFACTEFEIFDQFFRDVKANIGLRLFGRAADVRCENNVRQPLQMLIKFVAVLLWLIRKYIDRGACDLSAIKGFL